MLIGHYLEHEWNCTVIYEDEAAHGNVDGYIIGWPEYFDDHPFHKGSVVIDPWRTLKHDAKNLKDVTLISYGNTREEEVQRLYQ